MFFVCCGNFRTDSRKYLNRTATTILLWTILIFSITLASIFGYGIFLMKQVAFQGVDTVRIKMDSSSSLLFISAADVAIKYTSYLDVRLCDCSTGVAPVHFSSIDNNCATLSQSSPSLSLFTSVPPTSLDSQVSLSCGVSVWGIPFPRVNYPLFDLASSLPTAYSNNAALRRTEIPDKSPVVPFPLSKFETTSIQTIHPLASLLAEGLAIRSLEVDIPGVAIGLLSESLLAVCVFPPLRRVFNMHGGLGDTSFSYFVSSNPSSFAGFIFPQLPDLLSSATGAPSTFFSIALESLGFPSTAQPRSAPHSSSLGAPATLTAVAVPLADVGAALDAVLVRWNDQGGSVTTCPVHEAALGDAPVPWLRSFIGASGTESSPPHCGTSLFEVVLGVGEPVPLSLGGGVPPSAFNPIPGTGIPRISLVFTSSALNADLKAPRAVLSATLGLSRPTSMARNLFVLLRPYAKDYPAPVTVETHVPVTWRLATPVTGGKWAPGPPRSTTLLSQTVCGQLSAFLGMNSAGDEMAASVIVELNNTVGCFNHVMKEWGLGLYAGVGRGLNFIQGDAGGGVTPRGGVKINCPSLGVVTLPLAINLFTWLAGSVDNNPTTADVVLLAAPHAASVFPGIWGLTSPDPANPTLSSLYGLASHPQSTLSALDAGFSSGCAGRFNSADSGGACWAWEQLWRSSGFTGVSGMMLSGLCADPLDASLCVSAFVEADLYGLLYFSYVGTGWQSRLDAMSANLKESLWSKVPKGRAPARVAFPRNLPSPPLSPPAGASDVSYALLGLLDWELSSSTACPYLKITSAMLSASVNLTLQGRTEAPGTSPSNLKSYALPRVDTASCYLPLPGAGVSPSGSVNNLGMGNMGFNVMTSKSCTLKGIGPLLDLMIDNVVASNTLGFPGLGLSALGWVFTLPSLIVQLVAGGIASLIAATGTADSGPLNPEWPQLIPLQVWTGLGSGLSVAAPYVLGLFSGSAPGAVVFRAGAVYVPPLLANDVDSSATPSGLGVGSVSLTAFPFLGTTPLGNASFMIALDRSGAGTPSLIFQNIVDLSDPTLVPWKLLCVLKDDALTAAASANPATPRPMWVTGEIGSVDRASAQRNSLPYTLDVGAVLAAADYAVSRFFPWDFPLAVTQTILYGLRRYSGTLVDNPSVRGPCPTFLFPSPSPTPGPTLSPGAGSRPSNVLNSPELLIGVSIGTFIFGIAAAIVVGLVTGMCKAPLMCKSHCGWMCYRRTTKVKKVEKEDCVEVAPRSASRGPGTPSTVVPNPVFHSQGISDSNNSGTPLPSIELVGSPASPVR